jgi:hypothetical protein
MDIYKKILISFVIILFSYIIWRLIIRRNNLNFIINNDKPNIQEGLGIDTAQSSELNSKKDTSLRINIKNVNNTSLPLMEYCIKGSYNSAFTGNYINTDMLSYLLSRGCRFFDFEVYYIQDVTSGLFSPQVGYSTDGNFVSMNSTNTILLDNVLSSLVANGFSQTAPNNNDPLFINLRIKSNNNDVYHAVAASVDFALRKKLYTKTVNKKTIMNLLMGHVILSVDKTINYNYTQYTSCKQGDQTCYDLTNYTNIQSGSTDMMLNRYTNILNQNHIGLQIENDNLHTNISFMNLILPDILPENNPNPSIHQFIMNYGCQIVPMKFYEQDDGLKEYEKFFNDNNSGLVTLSQAIIYFKKQEQLNT